MGCIVAGRMPSMLSPAGALIKMKDYAKLVKTSPERTPSAAPKPKVNNLVRSAKELQAETPKKYGNTIGLLLVLFIVLVVAYGVLRQYLSHHHLLGMNSQDKGAAQKPANKADANTTPQFDFYTVLPKGNVADSNATAQASMPTSSDNSDVSNLAQAVTSPSAMANVSSIATDTSVNNTAPQSSTAAPVTSISTVATAPQVASTASTGKYYLNVGDYATAADANQMLSQLLLLGVQASVNPKQDSGATAYEVIVGPFNDAAAMNVVKAQLAVHEINALVVQANS